MTSPKFAVISGANSSLAQKIARRLARDGWSLLLGSRDKASLDGFASAIKDGFGTAVFTNELDVSSSDSVSEFCAHSRTLTEQIDGLVHTAAQLKPYGSILEVEPEGWIQSIDVNLAGAFRVMHAFSRVMVNQKSGVMTFLSGGGSTSPLPTLSSYAVAKAGVVRLVETISIELAPYNIKVNAVAPGVMNTKMVQEMVAGGQGLIDQTYMARMQSDLKTGVDSSEEASELVAWLMTQEVPGLTGRIISAIWDDWRTWDTQTSKFRDENIFTLRRNT
jgi:3-oxoacyl-[acyl-carrier protein] reductase